MHIKKIRKIAKAKGVAAGNMEKPELIRSIQRAEGNPECYGSSGRTGCPEMNCLWKEDCLAGS
jgi:hypothetical protein